MKPNADRSETESSFSFFRMSIISDNLDPRNSSCIPLAATAGSLFALAVLISCTSQPKPAPSIKGGTVLDKAKRYNLVHVPEVAPGVRIDLRYRTSGNATGKPLYPPNMPCLLNRSAAEKLARAHRILKQDGFGILILDAWRPPESHAALWNAVQDPRWVVPPSDGLSLHCYGIAVDVTMFDLKTGRAVPMPSRFDEFSERAKSVYTGSDSEIARNISLLRNAMIKAGFRGIADEWWHYDLPGRSRVYRVSAKDLGLKLPQ